MKIRVRNINGRVLELDVERLNTIDDVKHMVQDKDNIPVDRQRLIYLGKQVEDGRTLADYNVWEGSTLELVLRHRPVAVNEGLSEKIDLTPDDINKKLNYWREEGNMSFDDDMDIVDPVAHSRHLDLLYDAVSQRSELKRCGGQYLRSDENTWTAIPSLIERLPVPDWMWDAFGTANPGRLPHLLGSMDDVLASLWKTSLILSGTLSSFYELKRSRFCNASFNLLLRLPSSDVVEIVRIPIEEVEVVQMGALGCMEDLSIYGSDQDILDITYIQANLWAKMFAPCLSLLERLHVALEAVEPAVDQMLAVGRITALLLDLALVSYSGSHGIRFDRDHLSNESGALELGWEDTPFGFRCALTRLACLDDFVDNREVWAFELRSGFSDWETARRSRPCSILAKMEDFADIWGPVYAVPDAPQTDKVRQYNVSKGIICRAGGPQPAFRNAIKCHWYNRPSWMRGLAMKFLPPSQNLLLSADDLLLIGGIMVEKADCDYSLNQYEADYGDLLNELGTRESTWRWDTRGASVGFSFKVGVTVSGSQKKIPETPLKQRILDRWQGNPERRNPHVLNQRLGVEISHCTGNARRVPLRALLTLKPMTLALERQFPGWKTKPWGGRFWAAISADEESDSAIVDVWTTLEAHRSEMAQLVCFALDLLSPTGREDSKVRVAFLHNGQESCLDLALTANTWGLLLRDTPHTATFAMVNEICLLCQVPNHSASACSRSSTDTGQTTLQSRLTVDSSQADWERVHVKSVGERFRKVNMGSTTIVVLAAETNLERLNIFARGSSVNGIELKYGNFQWGDTTAVYVQAAQPSHGGLPRAKTAPFAAPTMPIQTIRESDPQDTDGNAIGNPRVGQHNINDMVQPHRA